VILNRHPLSQNLSRTGLVSESGPTFANIARCSRAHALHVGLTFLIFRPGRRSLRHATIACFRFRLTTSEAAFVALR